MIYKQQVIEILITGDNMFELILCSADKSGCIDCDYSKEGLCDWPYKKGITIVDIMILTEVIKSDVNYTGQ